MYKLVLQILLTAGIHPLVAIRVCGLWGDAEKVYLMSKPYLDVKYKTLEEALDAEIRQKNLQGQVQVAENLVKEFNNNQNKAANE